MFFLAIFSFQYSVLSSPNNFDSLSRTRSVDNSTYVAKTQLLHPTHLQLFLIRRPHPSSQPPPNHSVSRSQPCMHSEVGYILNSTANCKTLTTAVRAVRLCTTKTREYSPEPIYTSVRG